MEVDKDEVIENLNISKIGAQGFYTSQELECPTCGRADGKFGIKFKDGGGLVNCWVCNYKSSIFQYLHKIGKSYLIEKGHKHDFNGKLMISNLVNNDNYDVVKTNTIKHIPISMPRGYKRISKNTYLQSRGVTQKQLEDFRVGYVQNVLYPELRDYIIFQLFQYGKLVGWIARTPFDKDWHDKNLIDFKLGKAKLKPRYRNSKGTEFQDILGGLDDITNDTDTVIIVEGLFDKLNLDNLTLGMGVAVCFTFGHNFSDNQIQLLKSKTSVKTVIIMYDEDSLNSMKKTSLMLSDIFDFIFVAPILDKGIDPGNLKPHQLSKLLKNLKDPIDYYSSIISINLRK